MSKYIGVIGPFPNSFALGANAAAIASNVSELTIRCRIEQDIMRKRENGLYNDLPEEVVTDAMHAQRAVLHGKYTAQAASSMVESFVEGDLGREDLDQSHEAILGALERIRHGAARRLRHSIAAGVFLDIYWEESRRREVAETRRTVITPLEERGTSGSIAGGASIDVPYILWVVDVTTEHRQQPPSAPISTPVPDTPAGDLITPAPAPQPHTGPTGRSIFMRHMRRI